MEYIQPNITIEDTIDIIKNKILSETPFSLTRFGDGEIHIINGTGDSSFKHKICSNWGYRYPEEISLAYDDASTFLIDSMLKSDIIGFMDENTRTLPVKVYNKLNWSLPNSFLKKIGRDINKTKICDRWDTSRASDIGCASVSRSTAGGQKQGRSQRHDCQCSQNETHCECALCPGTHATW